MIWVVFFSSNECDCTFYEKYIIMEIGCLCDVLEDKNICQYILYLIFV